MSLAETTKNMGVLVTQSVGGHVSLIPIASQAAAFALAAKMMDWREMVRTAENQASQRRPGQSGDIIRAWYLEGEVISEAPDASRNDWWQRPLGR